jgi:thiamine pyrophosphate-dependent acetolactate synthase large subunit-like protein
MFGFGSPPVFSPHVKFIQVEIGPEQLYANAKVELALLGDARSV